MTEIIKYLPILAILIVSNIVTGTAYNTSFNFKEFDKNIFFDGIKRALSVSIAFIGLSYAFDVVPIGGDVLTPELIMTTAIITYAAKVSTNLTKILGINIGNKIE